MANELDAITDYLLELDALKLVNRRTYIDGGLRVENSAEHSWHLAMACWTMARQFKLDVSEEKLLKLALIHDLGEIDAGDTFLYDTKRGDAHNAERDGVKRLEAHGGNAVTELSTLWEEQESGHSPETKLLKVIDRLLPFLHNINSEGKTWRESDVKRSQVAGAHAFIADTFPDIHAWMTNELNVAVQKGWLIDA